jgi:hypothetical protein
MIRTLGVAGLTLLLSTCPFGGPPPDGYARIEGRVLRQDGSPFQGRGFVLCGFPEDEIPSGFGHEFGISLGGRYGTDIAAPEAFGRGTAEKTFVLICRVSAPGDQLPFAVRTASVEFARSRSARTTTRIDLREGLLEDGSWSDQSSP